MHPMTGIDASMLPVRQLWVDGIRASRRSVAGPSLNLTWPHQGFRFNGAAPPWLADAAADQVELRWPSMIKNWIEPRCIVTSVNVSSRTMLLDADCYSNLEQRIPGHARPRPPAFFENVAGELAPGEFYATMTTLYYRTNGTALTEPPRGAVVPVQELLLNASGADGHTFEGLGFAHSTYRQPAQRGGYVTTQSTVLETPCPPRGCEPVGAVAVAAARNLSFVNCTFAHLGGTYALSIGNASQGVLVRGCTFTDLSGGAIKLANVLDTARAETLNDSRVWDADYLIERNVVAGAALEWRGAAAIFVGYVARLTLQHNTVTQVGYTGISLGWGWGAVMSFARDNHVLRNRLSGVMRALNDGGCIYTLGPQPGSSVEGNFCSLDEAPVVGCFYHDNGSRYFRTINNVADASPAHAPCVYLQGCCGSPALDIAVSELFCRDVGAAQNGCAAENCTIDQATLHVVNGAWPPQAQAIIAAAGADAAPPS